MDELVTPSAIGDMEYGAPTPWGLIAIVAAGVLVALVVAVLT